jgi:hypothetical protein
MTGSEVFLDTNILVYSSLIDFDEEKHWQCQKVIKNLNESDFSFSDYQEIETIGPAELIDEMNGRKDERENETGEQAESAD